MNPKVCANCKNFAIAGAQESPVFFCVAHCRWEHIAEPAKHVCTKDFDWMDTPQYEVEEQSEAEIDMNDTEVEAEEQQ